MGQRLALRRFAWLIAALMFGAFGLVTTAMAEQRTLGILNQKAPGWGVSQWFQLPDDKTRLDIGDFKDKVVYLYCFQSLVTRLPQAWVSHATTIDQTLCR